MGCAEPSTPLGIAISERVVIWEISGIAEHNRFQATHNSLQQQLSEVQMKQSGKTATANAPSEEFRFALGESSLGTLLVASSAKGVVSILIGDNQDQLIRDLHRRFPKAQLVRGNQHEERLTKRVISFLDAPEHSLDLTLDIRGTPFQRRVWEALQQIPMGHTSTYTDIAKEIGAPKAIRAVGNACSINNLAIAVPCHRVLHNDGSFSGGYHWGVERQRTLIKREASARQHMSSD